MMNAVIKKYYIFWAFIIFVGFPFMFFHFGDFPKKTFLKESISITIILSFFLVLGQFFIVRANRVLLDIFKKSKLIKFHKIIGYFVVAIFLLHPFLIVVPRFFESGITPLEAITKILTAFDNIGIVLGIVAWFLMLALGISSFFKNKLFKNYTSWRIFHGALSLVILILALWHSIDLGRHIDINFTIYMMILATMGLLLLLKVYFYKSSKKIGASL